MNEWVIEPLKRLLKQPAVVACLVILAVCATTLHLGAKALQVHFRKEAVSLQKPFEEMDVSKIAPYEVVNRYRISSEIEEELGTTEYIQWLIKDTSVSEEDPRHYMMLFVTYYTGNPDRVPHVPDWCYVGSGGRVEKAENLLITVPNNGTDDDSFRMRLLTIQIPRRGFDVGMDTKRVGYFFSVNGDYRCTRTEVRTRQGSLFDKYAYFSKVEMNVVNPGNLTQDEVVAAIEKMAQHIVPVLVTDHWPDWEALNAQPDDE